MFEKSHRELRKEPIWLAIAAKRVAVLDEFLELKLLGRAETFLFAQKSVVQMQRGQH